jgi:hypothetical protein
MLAVLDNASAISRLHAAHPLEAEVLDQRLGTAVAVLVTVVCETHASSPTLSASPATCVTVRATDPVSVIAARGIRRAGRLLVRKTAS